MRKICAWQWLMTGVLVAVVMGGSVVRAGLPASGGSQTNIYVDGNGDIWAAHIFTSNGTLTVSETAEVEYLIVAGGGGGGSVNWARAGGGGGAGGVLTGSTSVTASSNSVTVGSGGAGATSSNSQGSDGGDSTAFGLTAFGGGGGAAGSGSDDGRSGGSGGGGGASADALGGAGTPGQGNDGADGLDGSYGGGGGGAALAATNRLGGSGISSAITGPSVVYATGGDGGRRDISEPGADAVASTGDGGGGVSHNDSSDPGHAGGDGGSGIVVVRYLAGGDSTPPEIDTLSPTNNATDLFLDVDLVATFDEIILTNTAGSVVITNVSDSLTATTIPIGDSSQITVSGDTLTINPSNTLAFGKSYAVLIGTNALTDVAGNFFAGMTTTNTWSFQTLAPSAPVVTNLGPDEILDTTARLNGMVTAMYGDPLTAVRMYIGTNDPGPQATGWDTNYVITAGSVSENTPFAVVASNLLLETEYSYRVYASNSADEAWSAVTNFTTFPELSASGGSSIHYYTDAGGTSWIAHVFADVGSDNFIVDGPLNVEYLIVAGGGGGGSSYNTRQAGGGGAGGLFSGSMSLTASTNSVTVGAGGVGGTGTSNGGDGGNSSALGLTAEGGGGGAYAYAAGGGNDGGCGGGGGSQGGRTGGTGSQGGDGADGDSVSDAYGGGGGGASANGSTGSGGSGHTSAITGTSETYAQGGDGGIKPASAVGIVGVDALDNTGSGGGGSSNNIGHASGQFAGGAGGSGIVVVRYLAGGDSLPPQITPLSPTNNATGVLVDADFTASFDEVVETNTTGAITITNLSDNTLVTTIAIGDTNQVTVSGTTMTIDPTNDLAFATDYAVLIDDNALQDLVGNAFEGITDTNTWAFQTIVPTAPAVTNTGATRVGAAKARLNGQITTFNGVPLRELRIYFGTTDGDEIANDWDTNYVFDVASIAEGVGFYTNVVDLLGIQSYSYRVYASNDYGHAWSGVDTFTTEPAGTVTLDDTAVFNGDGSFTASEISDFDPSGADKLVVTISAENDAPTGVTYGGQAMTLAVQRVNTIRRTYIWYLDDPGSAGDLEISPASSLGGSLLALSGTRAGVGPTNMTESLSTTITTERDNTFVVASFVENGGANGTTAQSPFTSIFTADVGSSCGASGYLFVSNAATLVTATFDGSSGNDPATAVAGFEGVTPPGNIAWTDLAVSDIAANSATLSATLAGTDADVTTYWDTDAVADPATHTDWADSVGPSAAATGTVSRSATGLSADTTYYYAFYGTNTTYSSEGWSIASSFITAFTAAQAPSFTGTSLAENRLAVTLSWTDNADNETGYRLQRALDGGSFETLAVLAANSTSVTDAVPEAGQYTYRVAATNSANGSLTDPVLCETTVTIPKPDFGVSQTLPVTDPLGSTVVQSFEVEDSGSVLVVGFYRDGTSFNNIRFGDGGGIESGDQAADGVITSSQGALAYFLNPATGSGNAIRVDSGSGGVVAGAWVLSGVDLGEPVISGNDSITTTTPDMYIVSWAYRNGAGTLSPSGSSVIETRIDLASEPDGTVGSAAGGSYFAETPATYDVSWDNDGSGSPLAFAFKQYRSPSTVFRFR